MKKLLIIAGLVITIMATDKFVFEKSEQANAFQSNVGFKADVSQALNELLGDKIFEVVWKNTFHWITLFESLDGFYTNTGVTQSSNGSYIQLETSGVINNEVEINKQPSWQGLITFSQQSYFRTAILFSHTTNQTIYMTVGNKDTTNYYGFKVVNANLYGVTYDGTTENTVLLQAITATTYNLEARYSPGNAVIFLVDSTEKGVISSNLPVPSVATNAQLMDLRVKADAAEVKNIQLSFFEYFQKRNILK